jgi:hypothetical protein
VPWILHPRREASRICLWRGRAHLIN